MHPLHAALARQLAERLKEHGIVVVYDPRSELRPFFERELTEAGKGHGELPRVFLGEQLVFLARFEGSFFALRAQVEPLAARDRPDPLLVYLAGMPREPKRSVLMELELGGMVYEPQLKKLARSVLGKRHTDGQIDEWLKNQQLGYDDIAALIRQGEDGGSASVLKTVFGDLASEPLLARWLAEDDRDRAVTDKGALPELAQLIEARLGLRVPAEAAVAEARERTLRHVLVAEFRSDLKCEPPQVISRMSAPSSKEQTVRAREVAARLRAEHPARYIILADDVEAELGLARAEIDPALLGSIDTFRFEERALLRHAFQLTAEGKHDAALEIATGRSRSFWVDREVARQAQWECCRLAAELGREIERVKPEVASMDARPAKWIDAYAKLDGWHTVDTRHRQLEAWIASMDEDPEGEKAIGLVRRNYEDLLGSQATGFSSALREAGWTVKGPLHQTHIFPEVVKEAGGRVAYFLVDSMRFEMGMELARKLVAAKECAVRPAVAALPTITPVGMAALLPGAAASFSVGEHKGQLGAAIEGTAMANLNDRQRFLRTKVPDVVDMTLGAVLTATPSKLTKGVGGAWLIVVRSQEIDSMGEADEDLAARQLMGSILDNLVRAVRKLVKFGVTNFVITADHGHLFGRRKEEDMRIDSPGGKTVDSHRRCWIGHGGATPPATARIAGAELGYDSSIDFVFPTGLGVFKAGGGLSYHHGGMSLQELIVPVVTFRMPESPGKAPKGKLVQLTNLPSSVTNRTFGIGLRTEANIVDSEPLALRVVLLARGEQVGHAGMAHGAELERDKGILRVAPGREVSLGILLTRDTCEAVQVIVQDSVTDAVLDQSDPIPVKLGI